MSTAIQESARAPCVHHLFEQQVARTPDAVAVVFEDRRLSYRELDARANQVAHFLRASGAGPESLVGVCLERRPELVIALLGVWKAGAAYVPLDPAYPRDRLAFMVEDAGIRALLTERKCHALFASASLHAVCLDDEWASTFAGEPTESPDASADPASLAYVMYTSGSTGKPKGAMILHGGLVNYLTWAIEAYGVHAGGSVPVHSSIAFDLTVTSLYPALLAGAHVELLTEQAGAQHLLAALRRTPRSVVKITPAHLDVLTQQLRPDELAGLTNVFVIGGENLPAESLTAWREHAPATRLINEYGPTETVVGCCIHEVIEGDPYGGPVPIGLPIARTELYVLDEQRKRVATGVMGELYIGGAGVARGYLNRPDLTRERFLDDPFSGRPGARLYKTGDLARQREDGVFEFFGRVDDQVKVRGYRIELGEIEAAIAGHPAVQSCAVLAREDTPGNKRLVGYVVARTGASETPTSADLQAFVAKNLPEYMVPAHVIFLPSLPLTVNGKVDRKSLPAPSEASATSGHDVKAPRTDTERKIAAIWCKLLKVEAVGVDVDFFDLGGHSLLAIKALAQMRDVLGVDLPPQTLFEHSTVEALAVLVGGDEPAEERAPAPIPRVGGPGPHPASFAQQQLWLLDQLVPDSPAYTIVDVVPLPGAYQVTALKKALHELVTRHEVLRTTFLRVNGQLMQRIAAPFEPALAEIDLSAAPPETQERDWARAVREQGQRPFDLSRLPLLRVTVVHFAADVHRLLVTVHHVIADEWSMELLHGELTKLYAAFARDLPSPLAPLPIQYADFATWQHASLQGEIRAEQVAYWTRELHGASPILALPVDKPRPASPTLRGATFGFSVPKAIADALHALGRREQATPFMVLEAAFATLLHRYTGQDDVLVGTPISGRTHTETQALIGCFLNTVVLRAQFPRDLDFRGLLKQVRERALGAYAHADLPFEHLVAEIAPERDPGRTPLFQAMFIQHDRDGVSQVSKVSGNEDLGTGTSKFDLTMFVAESEAGLEGLVEYSTDLFERETIARLTRSYGQLLQSIARNPEEKVARLSMLAEADRFQLVAEWNQTASAPPELGDCLHELFMRQASRTPSKVAATFAEESLTYAELDRRSTLLARHLARLGVGPDVLVGLLVERSLDMLVGLLAILKAGGAYVPLDPSFPAERLAHMVDDSRMLVLVTHRGLEETLHRRPDFIVDLDGDRDAIAMSDGTEAPEASATPSSLAYVLYTSGSTGLPKGVAISHAAIVNFVLSMQRAPGIGEGDSLLAVTTLSFDIAALELYVPLVTGAKVVIASREDVVDPRRLIRRLETGACTVMQATPATWRALVDAGWKGSPRLKALSGGEALPPDLARALLPRCAELWNMYGPTETTVWSTLHKMTAADGSPPIGRPIANTQVYVVDAELAPVPPGAVGELYIGGRGLARGYLNREELTNDRFVPSPFVPDARMYKTGDLARWRVDGNLECLGRTDHQVKLRGYRIELGEIEACLARHAAVRQAVVVAREDVPGDKRLVGYVVAEGPPADLTDQLRATLRASLPEYMVPAHVMLLPAMPLTPNGKVDRKALPAPTAAKTDAREGAYVAPRSDLEISLAAAWQRILRVERVGIHDDFFELGGNSLSVLNLMLEMEQTTGVEVTLGSIFRTPTIAALVESLGGAAEKDTSMVVPLQPAGAGRPIFCLCGVSLYQELAHSLGDAQPVFGVYVPEDQAITRQALKGEKLDISIPRLAQAYYDAIVKVAPRGPYRIAGSSFGGIVALEVASMMRQKGAEVELVALLDTLSPRGIHRNWRKWIRRRAGQLVNGEAPEKVLYALSRLRDKLVGRGVLPGALSQAQLAQVAFDRKQQAYFAAIASWQTRRIVSDYKIVLFRASHQLWGPQDELQNDYGWHYYLSSPITVVDVPGDHLGILKSPHVADLGRKVREHAS